MYMGCVCDVLTMCLKISMYFSKNKLWNLKNIAKTDSTQSKTILCNFMLNGLMRNMVCYLKIHRIFKHIVTTAHMHFIDQFLKRQKVAHNGGSLNS